MDKKIAFVLFYFAILFGGALLLHNCRRGCVDRVDTFSQGADMSAQIIRLPVIARTVSPDRLAQIAMELATQQGAPDQAWRILVQAGYKLYEQERSAGAK